MMGAPPMGAPLQMPMQMPMQTQMQTMMVQVPPGVGAGMPLQISTPIGPMQIVVPAGVGPGMMFPVQVPTPAAQVTTTMTTTMVTEQVEAPVAPPTPAAPAPSAATLFAKGTEMVFSLFAKLDTDKSREIDASELKAAFESDPALMLHCCELAGLSTTGSPEMIAIEVLRAADSSGDGALQVNELEVFLKGWKEGAFQTREDMTKANQVRRLAGAAERAERARARDFLYLAPHLLPLCVHVWVLMGDGPRRSRRRCLLQLLHPPVQILAHPPITRCLSGRHLAVAPHTVKEHQQPQVTHVKILRTRGA